MNTQTSLCPEQEAPPEIGAVMVLLPLPDSIWKETE